MFVTESLMIFGFSDGQTEKTQTWKPMQMDKKDERGIVIKNKARLVAQGYTQEEGIYYDKVFAPVARIKAIRLFLAYASFKDFVVYQMDVKSAFLYGKIEEEVSVYQPPGFEDPDFPDRVYKVEKALYGLHQAPRACPDYENGEATAKVKTVNGEVQLHSLVDRKKVIITESTIRRDLHLEDAEGTDFLPNGTIFEQLTHMGYEKLSQKLTFYKAFFSPQWKFLIHTILQCLSAKSTTWNEFSNTMASAIICLATTKNSTFLSISLKKKQKPRKPKRKDTEIPQSGGPIKPIADEAANEENVPTHSNDPLLSEKKGGSRTHKLKRLFKVGRSAQVVSSEDEGLGDQDDASKQRRKITDIDQDAEVTLVDETQGRYDDAQMFDTDVFNGEEVFVAEQSEKVIEEVVSTAEVSVAATITTEEITLAQALAKLRSAKPKVVVQESVQSTTTTAPSTIPKAKSITFRDTGESTKRTTLTPIPSNIKDKGKAKMIELEKPLKNKKQIRLDEELAFKLQAEVEEQSRLAREKDKKVEEANISWDNVQAMIEVDRLLAKRLQAREQEELTDEEKARLFVELLEKRKKHFAALRA
ncbi:putative ribonuclease H-like domain-containing protein [Tanacetum coccineum]